MRAIHVPFKRKGKGGALKVLAAVEAVGYRA
jgi:hypothetical protein